MARRLPVTLLSTQWLLALAAASAEATTPLIPLPVQSYVLEPFDVVRRSDQWFTSFSNNRGALELSSVPVPFDGGIDDESVVQVDYETVHTENWGGYATVSSFFGATAVSCVGSDRLALQVRILEPQSEPGRTHLRVMLFDDSDSQITHEMERYISFKYILDNPAQSDWLELDTLLEGDTDPASPFYLPDWSGGAGNGILDLHRIRGWSLEWNIDQQGGLGTTSSGSMLLHRLACVQEPDIQSVDTVERENSTVTTTRLIGSMLDSPLFLDETGGILPPGLHGEGRWRQSIVDTTSTSTRDTTGDNGTESGRSLDSIASFVGNGTLETEYNLSATADTHKSVQLSFAYEVPRHLYYDLGDHVEAVILDVVWQPTSQIHSHNANVQLTIIAFNETCYLEAQPAPVPCTEHIPMRPFTSNDDDTRIVLQPSEGAQQVSFRQSHSHLDWSRIKGYVVTFEVDVTPTGQLSGNLDADADVDADADADSHAEASGMFVVSNVRTETVIKVEKGRPSDGSDDKGDSSDAKADEPTCNFVQGVSVNPNGAQWKTYQYLGNQCCDVCVQAGDECMFYMVSEFICYTAPYLDFVDTRHSSNGTDTSSGTEWSPPLRLDRSENEVNSNRVFWKDDAELRGDLCQKCVCDHDNYSVDCRGKNLLQVPKTLTAPSPGAVSITTASDGTAVMWKPRVLDLRQNPRLFVLEPGMLDPDIFADLQQLLLPATMTHLSPSAFDGLPNLRVIDRKAALELDVSGESRSVSFYGNTITDPNGIYSNICCSRGGRIDTFATPSNGLTFCDLQNFQPGIDSQYLPFAEYFDAAPVAFIRSSSSFMAEAAESVEKCAEYCSIAEDCNYFTYDTRNTATDNVCRLLHNNGTRMDTFCCGDGAYSDEAKQIPGFTSGYPPRTRHVKDNARVLFLQTELVANVANNFTVEYAVKLGSQPLRGAVWIEAQVSSPAQEGFDVVIQPRRIALYDNDTTATVTVQLVSVDFANDREWVLVRNGVSACDEAFTELDEQSFEGVVQVTVENPPPAQVAGRIIDGDDSTVTVLIATLIPAGIVVLAIAAYLYVERRKHMANAVWQIDPDELSFSDPPEIIGQGTFGLVLLGEYRGTQVAVKRALPLRKTSKRTGKGSSPGIFGHNQASNSGEKAIQTSQFGGDSPHMRKASNAPLAILGEGSESRNTEDACSTRGEDSEDIEAGTTLSSDPVRTNSSSVGRITSAPAKVHADFISEMRHLSKLRHPNITTVMGAVMNRNDPLLVMEYMDHGSLHDVLHNETIVLEGEQILPILVDVSLGIRFLHAADPQIVHGDLKSHNILINSRFHAKVADFGLSQKKSLGARGTPYWMAPELLRDETVNSGSTDVYSFGIILYEIYSRSDPYEGEDYEEVIKLIADPSVCKRPGVPSECPDMIRNLMAECLKHNSQDRPTFEQLHRAFKACSIAEVEPRRERQSLQSQELIATGRTTDDILHGVFPRHIAEALKEGRKIEPESHDSVTIFFSDIVGFTELAATMTALEISDMLDRLYHAIDKLSEQYDVFKVETIGDAYMACSNLVKDQSDDHAYRIALFAIHALEVANRTPISLADPSRGTVSIRVGFHTGPVVANVVGSRNPRYCLFGDTVNTASRMESHSMRNRIHCSSRAARCLQMQDVNSDVPLSVRGSIDIKGKGKMKTFWVNEKQKQRISFATDHDSLFNASLRRTTSMNSGTCIRSTDTRTSTPTTHR